MGKEIERKFLWNRKIDFYSVVCSYPYEVIEDYYFNETTRLRTLHKPIGLGKQFITIKSIVYFLYYHPSIQFFIVLFQQSSNYHLNLSLLIYD